MPDRNIVFPFTLDGTTWNIRLPCGAVITGDWTSREEALAGYQAKLQATQLQAEMRLVALFSTDPPPRFRKM
jgi:hypothetical protein